MAFIELTDIFLTGIKEIDAQHQKIVNFINAIYNIKKLKIDEKFLEDSIKSFINYINYHLNYEEEFLQRRGYPYLEEHRTEHEDFKNFIKEFFSQALENRDFNNFLKFIKTWFLNHILSFDKKYSKYMLNKEGGEKNV